MDPVFTGVGWALAAVWLFWLGRLGSALVLDAFGVAVTLVEAGGRLNCCVLSAFQLLSGPYLESKRSGLGPLETGQVGQVPCESEGQASAGERS